MIMSKLPREMRNKIREEAKEWDTTIAGESVEDVQKQLSEAELFKTQRPPRQSISLWDREARTD
jgi:hypothetical protein